MIKIAEELVSYEAGIIIEFLNSNPGVSEFDIVEETNIQVQKVRSILYELKALNLIDYEKKKDKEKGWYLYYWRVSKTNFDIVYKTQKKKALQNFEERLEKEETTTYYICPNLCKRLVFEESLEHNFACPVCNSLMHEENKERKIRMLKRNIEEHKKILVS